MEYVRAGNLPEELTAGFSQSGAVAEETATAAAARIAMFISTILL
jgi:hypothetical protein